MHNMRDVVSYRTGRIARASALLVLAATCLGGAATAQQPAPKKAPAVASVGQDDQDAGIIPLGWVKLCRKYTATSKQKDGKEDAKDLNICLTKNETIFAGSGRMRSSAAIRQIDGDPKRYLMVTVPLEMDLRSGLRAAVFPKDVWEKTQKGGQLSKAEEAKLKPLSFVYTQCHPGGCDGELDATQLISELTTGGGLMVFAFRTADVPIPFPIPLDGFNKAYAEAPISDAKYDEIRRKLRQQTGQPDIRGTIVVPKQLRP
jgi:invasion protein IalB